MTAFIDKGLVRPKAITIVGGGTAGWMAANLILHAWPSVQVTLVESDDIGIIGVGEGATPYLKTFFKRLNIDEKEWMPACDATYKVGINFENWSGRKGHDAYFHPFFSSFDKPVAEMFFHNCGLKRRGWDAATQPDDFFVAGELARQKKSPLFSDAKAGGAHSDIDYAYHFDSGKLGQFLKAKAKAKGLRHIVDNVLDIAINTSGAIDHITTAKSGVLGADIYIDCTGFRARLIHQALKREYVSYADNLFNNAAVAIQTPNVANAPLEVQTRSIALSNGWMWKIPLISRQGNGYVYSDSHITASQAETELRSELGIGDDDDIKVKHLKMRIGRLSEHWHQNCLAVGLSQGFIEPLEATALMLTQLTIDQFIQSFDQPNLSRSTHVPAFNKQLNTIFDGVRDYIVAHYQLTHRSDTDYWRDNKHNLNMPEVLGVLKDAWLSGQDVEQVMAKYSAQLVYLRPSWYCILAGMGLFPADSKATSKSVSVDQAREYSRQVVSQYF